MLQQISARRAGFAEACSTAQAYRGGMPPSGGGGTDPFWQGGSSSGGGSFVVSTGPPELVTRCTELQHMVELSVRGRDAEFVVPREVIRELRKNYLIKMRGTTHTLSKNLLSGEEKLGTSSSRYFPYVASERTAFEDSDVILEYCASRQDALRSQLAAGEELMRRGSSSFGAKERRELLRQQAHYDGVARWWRHHWFAPVRHKLQDAMEHTDSALRVQTTMRCFNYCNMVRRVYVVCRVALGGLHAQLWDMAQYYMPKAPAANDYVHADLEAKLFWQRLEVEVDRNVTDPRTRLQQGPVLAPSGGQRSGGRPGTTPSRQAVGGGGGAGRPRNGVKCPVCSKSHSKASCPVWHATAEGKAYLTECKRLRGGLGRSAWKKANPGQRVPTPPMPK